MTREGLVAGVERQTIEGQDGGGVSLGHGRLTPTELGAGVLSLASPCGTRARWACDNTWRALCPRYAIARLTAIPAFAERIRVGVCAVRPRG